MIGLLFLGGEGPYIEDLTDVVASFFCGEDFDKVQKFVVAADSGAALALECGFVPNVVVGDFDSASSTLLEKIEKRGTKLIKTSVDKDDSDFVLALKVLLANECEKIILVGGGGGRIDHLLAIFSELSNYPNIDLWITKNEIIYSFATSKFPSCEKLKLSFSKTASDIATKQMLSFFKLSSEVKIATSGLKWDFNDFDCNGHNYSLSNEISKENFFVELKSGQFCIVTNIETPLKINN